MKKLKIALFTLLEVFGVLWLIVEITSFFSTSLGQQIKSYAWIFFLAGVLITIYRSRKKKHFNFQIANRDVRIEIVIGDLFNQSGGLIIGSNTSFITNPSIISETSIQGIFCKKFFPKGIKGVSAQIDACRHNYPVPYGTTAIVKYSEGSAYFCAIADINPAGVAQGTIDNLRIALGGLWSFLAANAEKEMLNTAILGSGFSRIAAKREDLFKEIIRSFIAATSEGTFCDGLRVVILQHDINQYNIDIDDLVRFVEYSCKYAIVSGTNSGTGTAEV